jgi:RHS repeat-associated protein
VTTTTAVEPYAGGAQSGGSDYAYDGDGRRVKKVSASEVTVFVYDAAGTLIAEYGGAQPQAGSVSYLTRDTLGSTRVVTGQSGTVHSRHDYLPFGEEIDVLSVPGSGRGDFSSYNYGTVRQKFTGYERDDEIDLDYAQARYFSSQAGRFISIDPILSSGKAGNPQTWNRYIYALNNPVNVVDPLGLDPIWLTQYNKERGLTAVRSIDSSDNSLQSLLDAGWQKATFDENGEFRYTADNGAGGVEVAVLLSNGLWKWAGEYDNQVTGNPTPAAPTTQIHRAL